MKVIIYFLLSAILLLSGITALLQIPFIQTVVVQQLATYVSEKINYPISIGGVNIKWFDTIILEDVSINDTKMENLIGVDRIEIDFDLESIIKGDTITIEHTNIFSPVVILSWDVKTNSLNINDFIRTVQESFKKNKNKKPTIKPFEILSASIHDGYFGYSDHRKERKTKKMFDHNYFSVDSIYVNCNNFFLHRDTVQLQINQLQGVEENIHFKLHDITTFFRYTKHSLEFQDINAHIEDSYISKNIEFRYKQTSSLNHFIDSVSIKANLDSTVIHTKDLAHFAPSVGYINDTWTIYGDYKGKVGNFSSKNASVYFGENSRLKGEIGFEGLPNFKETFLTINLHNSKTNANDLERYFSKEKHIKTVRKFGTIKFDADFIGFPTDFAAHGDFQTALGELYSDIRFEIKDKGKSSFYSGQIKTNHFELGKFLDDKRIGAIGIEGKIIGSGFSIKKSKIELDAEIAHIKVNQYKYQNITTKAKLQNEFFSGNISIVDTNLIMNANGTIDLRNGAEIVNISTELERAYLHRLNITKDSVFIRSDFNMNLQNFDLDLIEGNASLSNTFVDFNGNKVRFSDFDFQSVLDSNNRTFDINSNLFGFHAKGNFQFKQIYKDLNNIVKEYGLMFLNDSIQTKNYYTKKKENPKNYHIDFKAEFKDANQLFDLIEYNAYISPGTIVDGRISQGKTTVFDLSTEIEYFEFKNYGFHNSVIEVNSAKMSDSTKALAMLYFNCEQQDINNKPTTERLFFEGIWNNDTIDFTANIHQYKKSNAANLKGNISFNKNRIFTSLNNSKLTIIDKEWTINDKNNIVYKNNVVSFNNVVFNNKQQTLTLNGEIGKNKTTIVQLENFDLLNLEPFTKIPLKGNLSGKAHLSDLWIRKPSAVGEIHVNNFKIKEELLGDIDGACKWNEETKKFQFNVDVSRDSANIAKLVGHYTTKNELSPLYAEAIFNNTDIGFLEPLLYGQATNIQGKANGKIIAKGTLSDLKLKGSPKITNGEFTINYFKTRYKFNEPIHFSNDSIIIKKGILTDTLWGTKGTIDGYITHKTFKEFYSNLNLYLNKTLALNTTSEDNQLYYGQAFGTGHISLIGPFTDLKVHSDELTSEKGTKLYVPLDGTESITQKDYIRFVSREQKAKEKLQKELESKQVKQTSGISADLNFNINENAHFEIIFDKKAGDIITGYGKGNVLLKMDTRGDFDVYGTCEITQGTYNFTLVNLINKAFKIEPGSEITWSGDPYEGKLNIKAAYRQNASLLPIVKAFADSTFLQTNPDAKRRVPVTVFLNLKGRLLSPEIGFDIEINGYPNNTFINQAVNDFHTRIKNNEQNLNNQVFSLMVLKQLSPFEQLQLDVGSSSANSVSELFSNQFSYWVSQFDENLEVDIDLSGFDEENNNTFRLRLSYSILDGKIRITRDGNFTNVENQSQLANVFGEWTIEYMLTENGKLKLKAYNKTSQNSFASALNNSTNSLYGVSMSYTESFDSLKDLFRKNPNKTDAKKEDEITITEEPEKKEENSTEETLEDIETETTGNEE